MNMTRTVVNLCWLVLIIYWLTSAASSKRSARPGLWRPRAGIRLIILIVAVVVVQLPASRKFLADLRQRTPDPNSVAAIIGVIICVAGVALAVGARAYLGRNWGMPMSLREGHELVTSGPYAYIRHPIYSGILLLTLGSAIAVNPAWLAPFVLFLLYFVQAARMEERDMTKQFPDVYPAYQRRTKMLIPFLL
jgi:protein-S-isoprenylcysteine O-methyltransferase Ste14